MKTIFPCIRSALWPPQVNEGPKRVAAIIGMTSAPLQRVLLRWMKSVSRRPKRSETLSVPCCLTFSLLLTFIAWISWGFTVIFAETTSPASTASTSSPQVSKKAATPKLQLISRNATFHADVRGNLGPASVMADPNGTDWIKERWQAASDMHGTAIRGKHWVTVQFQAAAIVRRIVLDWETAYSDDYAIQGILLDTDPMILLFDSKKDHYDTRSYGQSPGVKQVLPLHVIHEMTIPSTTRFQGIQLDIRSPFHRGWGVSLWSVQVYGE